MDVKNYSQIWLALVEIEAAPGFQFNDLIDPENTPVQDKYIGAAANVLIKATTIHEALDILPRGMGEKNFVIKFIDKVENAERAVENSELKEEVIAEIDFLLDSNYVFMISDRIFPYTSID